MKLWNNNNFYLEIPNEQFFIKADEPKQFPISTAEKISRLIANKPEVLNDRPEWKKYEDFHERAVETRREQNRAKPGIRKPPKENEESEKSFFIKGADGHVASVAVMDGTKMLMGKRRDNGRWTNPGGHLENGEKKHAAAVREVYEEAGLEIDPKKLKHLASKKLKTHTGKEKTIHAFVINHKAPTSIKNDPDKEVERWQWVETKDGLPKHVKENLHSPKNLVLQKLGLLKSLPVGDLIKIAKEK